MLVIGVELDVGTNVEAGMQDNSNFSTATTRGANTYNISSAEKMNPKTKVHLEPIRPRMHQR